MAWYYNVTNNSTPPTPNDYIWFGLNASNQDAALIYVGGTYGVTKIRVLANGHSSSVYTRLCIWNGSNGYLVAQSGTFTMTAGYESVGGQAWQEITLPTPILVTQGNYFVGLYRNPSGGHISGTHTSLDGYQKTNTNGFPSVVGMAGYQIDYDEGILVGLYLISAPSAPYGAAVARNSDTSATVNWFNNSSADAPYSSIEIQRWDNITNGYYRIATISGSATSYTDTTIRSNRMYKYAVSAKNTVGTSNFNYTNYIKTTPTAPSNVVAYSSGTSVIVTWSDNSANEDHFYIQSSTYSGGSWGAWTNEAEISAGSTSWTDTTPPNVVKYRVKALTDTYNNLSSAYVESNQLSILQAPNPPTNLSPDNVFIDATEINRFSWLHNPLDGSNQTKYSIQYKVDGGSYPGTPQVNAVSSSNQYHDFAIGTFTNGNTYKYQVKTWGAYSTGSNWSTEKTFGTYARCSGTITSPTVADDYTTSNLTVTWIFSGYAQTEYLVKLYDSNLTLLETKSGSGTSTSAVFETLLTNLTDYKVTLQVKDTTNLWSVESSVLFNTVFATPPVPTFVLNSDVENGLVNLAITNPSPTGLEVPAVSNNIYRSLDGGLTYTLILANTSLNTTVTDYLPLIGLPTYYYVEAVSSTPTVAPATPQYISLLGLNYYFFNTGSNFLTNFLLCKNVDLNETNERETVYQKFEGRTYPLKFQSDLLNNEINFSCEILASDLTDLKNMVNSITDIFYRDYLGRYFLCGITKPQYNKIDNGTVYKFSCVITRIEGD